MKMIQILEISCDLTRLLQVSFPFQVAYTCKLELQVAAGVALSLFKAITNSIQVPFGFSWLTQHHSSLTKAKDLQPHQLATAILNSHWMPFKESRSSQAWITKSSATAEPLWSQLYFSGPEHHHKMLIFVANIQMHNSGPPDLNQDLQVEFSFMNI
jgi:hypothetical protein